jgi:S1-C subfamily serine protease
VLEAPDNYRELNMPTLKPRLLNGLAGVLLFTMACSFSPAVLLGRGAQAEPTAAPRRAATRAAVTTRQAAQPTATQAETTSTRSEAPAQQAQPVEPVVLPTPIPDALRAGFDNEEAVLINLYERVSPAVVAIEVETGAGGGSGSGFIISGDGYIVTNNHVVENANAVRVIFADGSTADANIIGADPYSDLALLKASRDGLPFVELADSDQVRVGQRTIAIGSPLGTDLRNTMTTGIVSGLGRSLPTESNFSNFGIIQTDAAINPGNSGGPLFNSRGQVIGVNTAIRTSNAGVSGQPTNSGIGFAVPANSVKRVVDQLRDGGVVRYPYFGASLGQIDSDRLGVQRGVYVSSVIPGGPADAAGIRGDSAVTSARRGSNRELAPAWDGDVILQFNGKDVTSSDQVISMLVNETQVGQSVVVKILRDGREQDIRVKIGERPRPQVDQ